MKQKKKDIIMNMIFFRLKKGIYIMMMLSSANLNSLLAQDSSSDKIPLPEHPRPDFQREDWINLNGQWQFQFDADNDGIENEWFKKSTSFSETIIVPFPWGSPLSQVEDESTIGWYARNISASRDWMNKRIYLIIGACDWHTTVWLDGEYVGEHQGGYTPFEFELTPFIKSGKEQKLIIRVDDAMRPFKLEGKQGYGNARGIWQTVYLEARGKKFIKTVHFSPDIDKEIVRVNIVLNETAAQKTKLNLSFLTGELREQNHSFTISKGKKTGEFEIKIPNPRLWTLDDPFLYEIQAYLMQGEEPHDKVKTYFGMRKISVVNLPGTDFPYIALNNKPIYLQTTLDQAYHPDGFYTFPSDEFIRDEILRSKRIGLNGMRIHVKIGIPRKLYWADRLGMLIMADVPNSWGTPDENMRKETEYALRNMVKRDYNHPAIFSWVLFNETWGLKNEDGKYTIETQEWVASMFKLAKSLDNTRLIEDNSPNRFDHVITDINSWHAYLPGFKWQEILDEYSEKTYPGSNWNFVAGKKQENQPNFNSECGNVWGYEGSTGDVDWSWDYHIMINEFRRHPKVCGWLYTEHHDVINEWNGYFRYDRSEKFTGIPELVKGMSLKDLHAPLYISTTGDLCREVKPGSEIEIPLWLSVMNDLQNIGKQIILKAKLYGWNTLGENKSYYTTKISIPIKPWMSEEISPLKIKMPEEEGLTVLSLSLENQLGISQHKNFTTFLVTEGMSKRSEIIKSNNGKIHVVRFAAKEFVDSHWSKKQWNVFDGLKVNGAGSGHFEYRVDWPEGLKVQNIEEAGLLFEASAKQLFGKDQEGSSEIEGNFMLGKGTVDPSLNSNAYPMTDTKKYPSMVKIIINNINTGSQFLEDDPADHRGILSWNAQKVNKERRKAKLDEAGSYGYLLKIKIPKEALQKSEESGKIFIRFEVDDALPGGLAIYGERFGRYPLDPTLIFKLK